MSDQASRAGPSKSVSPSQAQIVQGLCAGTITQYEVSHPGLSQYSGGPIGVSACGLAALNCARVILGKEQSGVKGEDLLSDMMQSDTVKEILQACAMWNNSAHLEVEDIYRSPAFRKSLKLESSDYGQPEAKHFKTVLRMLKSVSQKRGKMSCAVLTRPPEIISCLFVPNLAKDLFVIFDSHPRPQLQLEGASFIFHTSEKTAVVYLAELLCVDNGLLDGNVQWQAQLLRNFSSHIFTSRDSPTSAVDWSNQDALSSSMEILSLRAECIALRSRCTQLVGQNAKLTEDMSALQRRVEVERALSRSLLLRRSVSTHFARPSEQEQNLAQPIADGLSTEGDTESANDTPTPQWRETSNPQDIPSPPSTPGTPSSIDSTHDREHSILAGSREDTIGTTDLEFALEQQRLFDEENNRINAERTRLVDSSQGAFQCRICFEDHSREFIALIPGCDHCFCRDCILGHAITQIDNNRYPIFCPLCSADWRNSNPVALSNSFVQELGLSEGQYARFVEMEMASFSLPLHCRSCDRTFYVDREEFNEATIIECPLPGCNSTWCKTCNKAVDTAASGPHSCDGSAELTHLMRQEGWKQCPGCRTPIEKIVGCNHMTCSTPGCNTHFCYLCGQEIVQSRSRREIENAITAHYSRCRLIDDVPDQVPALPQLGVRHPHRVIQVQGVDGFWGAFGVHR